MHKDIALKPRTCIVVPFKILLAVVSLQWPGTTDNNPDSNPNTDISDFEWDTLCLQLFGLLLFEFHEFFVAGYPNGKENSFFEGNVTLSTLGSKPPAPIIGTEKAAANSNATHGAAGPATYLGWIQRSDCQNTGQRNRRSGKRHVARHDRERSRARIQGQTARIWGKIQFLGLEVSDRAQIWRVGSRDMSDQYATDRSWFGDHLTRMHGVYSSPDMKMNLQNIIMLNYDFRSIFVQQAVVATIAIIFGATKGADVWLAPLGNNKMQQDPQFGSQVFHTMKQQESSQDQREDKHRSGKGLVLRKGLLLQPRDLLDRLGTLPGIQLFDHCRHHALRRS
ncbi:hypothetical protein IEQ34_022921 [Dendrobium chrysotoxum]|uniref:Uncharacterized protein n=1 Tax=Dendrobium chrysotoxum TaxID=161865 RepID=A0AAV7FZ78_DENCH|nr:hypothetical protein IEQ34_022921 [Dendrobium chrysotoxum]